MIDWLKRNKLATILLVIVVLWFIPNLLRSFFGSGAYQSSKLALPSATSGSSSDSVYSTNSKSANLGSLSMERSVIPQPNVAPSDSVDRLVIQESNLSVQVQNVSEISDQITDFAKTSGGFMVSSSLQNPQEAASATLIIRVPQTKLKETLTFIRSKAIKVVSENLSGTDVTDQYTDIEARLATYNATKLKFAEILAKATQVQDILNVQREIINLQSQIDSLKGQQQYLEKTAQLSKITIYLSTDEFALPYAPSASWRPDVIFKTAVRSLVGTLRGIGELVIWLVVYSPIILVIVVVIWLIRRRMKSKTKIRTGLKS